MPKTRPLHGEHTLGEMRASGYRTTGPRQAIIDIVTGSRRALNPAQIHALARKRYPSLGLVTVYRTLEKLEELGLVQRVHHPRGCQSFLPSSRGHEHLLLCQKCGHAETFSGDNLGVLIHDIAERTGYRIEVHWLQLFGLCARCQK
ncbi:MAG: Fur family transcriptional regulator [Anaerolineales bacterium]